MSLRHLYKDLKEMGVYPDISKSDRELTILRDDEHHMILSSADRYYRKRFILESSTSEYGYVMRIYDHTLNEISRVSLSFSTCKMNITIRNIRKRCIRHRDMTMSTREVNMMVMNMVLDMLEGMG